MEEEKSIMHKSFDEMNQSEKKYDYFRGIFINLFYCFRCKFLY